MSLILASVAMSALAAPGGEDLASRRKALENLLSDHWQYVLSHNPEFASILGDKRWNDKASDLSGADIFTRSGS